MNRITNEITLAIQQCFRDRGVLYTEPNGIWDAHTQSAYVWFRTQVLKEGNPTLIQQPTYVEEIPTRLLRAAKIDDLLEANAPEVPVVVSTPEPEEEEKNEVSDLPPENQPDPQSAPNEPQEQPVPLTTNGVSVTPAEPVKAASKGKTKGKKA